MKISLRGWERDHGEHVLFDKEIVKDCDEFINRQSMSINDINIETKRTNVTVRWGKNLTGLNGDYFCEMKLTYEDIRSLFSTMFGSEIDEQFLSVTGLEISPEYIAELIRKEIASKYGLAHKSEDVIEDSPPELNLLQDIVSGVLQTLTDREENILRLTYGIGTETDLKGRDCYNAKYVGRKLNIKQKEVRNIHDKALRKLRHPTRSRKFRKYADFINEKFEHEITREENLLCEVFGSNPEGKMKPENPVN
jgi:hypothetical protein